MSPRRTTLDPLLLTALGLAGCRAASCLTLLREDTFGPCLTLIEDTGETDTDTRDTDTDTDTRDTDTDTDTRDTDTDTDTDTDGRLDTDDTDAVNNPCLAPEPDDTDTLSACLSPGPDTDALRFIQELHTPGACDTAPVESTLAGALAGAIALQRRRRSTRAQLLDRLVADGTLPADVVERLKRR